ncbi:MAG: isochorismatase family protein [Nocardiopsaceae bacterium]|jgi:tRNA-Thr(GGU) m(6)t(6)A37 methyltransferase TsaA|nr:isochorismatase family protein [Nocardiopsaceae bacterium]
MSSTALLVMDVQEAIVRRFGDPPGYLERMDLAISAARDAGIPVVYVVVGFRPGHPEVSTRNKSFAALAGAGAFTGADLASRIHPAIAPGEADLVVTKRRVSGFAGSDLDVLLRGLDADTLVLSGIATSGVVLSTLRQAADLDYRLVVLADGCLDADAEVHRVLTEKVFPRQADVMTVGAWTSSLASPAGSEPVIARPVGWVTSARSAVTDDRWAEVPAVISLAPEYGEEAIAGLEDFSHLEVIYQFHLVPTGQIESGARHPRENPEWPLVGIFAQRGKNRPNRIGVSRCTLVGVEGTDIRVLGLDAVNGTPVLDIKPYLREFGPRGEVTQPAWASELMREYY